MKKTCFNFIAFAALIFTLPGCMTGSLTDSTLPQTGPTNDVREDYLSGTPKDSSVTSFKRHLTRGSFGTQDTFRVLLITEPYLKAVSSEWAKNENKENNPNFQEPMNSKNIKNLVEDKTCFDFELNSDLEKAGEPESWKITIREVASQKEVQATMTFSKEYLVRNRGSWYQFSGLICANEKLDIRKSLSMRITPLHRGYRDIQLVWNFKPL